MKNKQKLDAFFFELDNGQDKVVVPNLAADNAAIATESWHLQLKNDYLNQLFLIPATGFSEIWKNVSEFSSSTLFTDAKAIVAYSTNKAAFSIQERNKSAFMDHILQIVKLSNSSKFLPLIASILKQQNAYFELFFNGYPADGLLEALYSCSFENPNKLLTLAKGKNLPPKAKYICVETFILHALKSSQPNKMWGDLEKFLNQAQKIDDPDSIPKDFFNQITKLLVKYRLEHFEFYIRQLFMFGLIKTERIGSLEDVVEKLNATFDLR